MELVKGICVDLTHKYELKLKNKKNQRIKNTACLLYTSDAADE